MRTTLLALLLTLLLPATAAAAVDRPGVAEIHQDGTTVTWVLGLHADTLTQYAGGDTIEAIGGYVDNNVRLSVNEESCRGGFVEATPERHDRVAYARVTTRFECPHEAGRFAVIDEMLLTTLVRYDLGGTSGTFRFDTDHTLMEVASPEFTRRLSEGFEAVVLSWEAVLFLAVLLLGARGRSEFGVFAAGATAAIVLGLGLGAFGVVSVSGRVLEALAVASVVGVAALPVLGIAGAAQRSIVFALAVVHGLALAPARDAVPGFTAGVLLAVALVVSLAGALPLAWRARDRRPGARARGRARSAAR